MAATSETRALELQLEQHRRELTSYCYRMLGSPFEAEDAVQETMIRAWRGIDRFEGRAALRSWLYRIATNVCLDMLDGRERRARPMDLGPAREPVEANLNSLPEVTWIQPIPDPAVEVESRETVRLAFVAALQHLPPRQRAVLILCEVLRWKAAEVAELLDTSVASVNSALQRARAAVEERVPDQSQQETLRALGDEQLRRIVEDYMDAMQRGDVEAVAAMLAEDAAWSMPPLATWYHGRDALRAFLADGPLSGAWRWRRVVTTANGQPAVAAYTWRDDEGCFRPFALDVLTIGDSGRIDAITAFIARSAEPRDPERFARYPDEAVDDAKAVAVFERFGLAPKLELG